MVGVVKKRNPYLNIPTYTISHFINENYDGIRHVVLFSFIGDITRKLFCIESFENANFTKLLNFVYGTKLVFEFLLFYHLFPVSNEISNDTNLGIIYKKRAHISGNTS